MLMVLIPTLIISAAFLLIGKRMIMMKSFGDELAQYEKDGSNSDIFTDWFYGWKFKFARDVHKWVIKSLGDNVMTWFIKISGGFFIFNAIMMLISSVFVFGS